MDSLETKFVHLQYEMMSRATEQRAINLALIDCLLQCMKIAANLTGAVADPAVRDAHTAALDDLGKKFDSAFQLVRQAGAVS